MYERYNVRQIKDDECFEGVSIDLSLMCVVCFQVYSICDFIIAISYFSY
jgi:hypothetical protein